MMLQWYALLIDHQTGPPDLAITLIDQRYAAETNHAESTSFDQT